MTSIPELKTERLLLREFREADLDAYPAICADPEVARYIGEQCVLSRSEAWRQMAVIAGHWQLRGFGIWAVEANDTRELIGRSGLWQPEGWPGFEPGVQHHTIKVGRHRGLTRLSFIDNIEYR